MRGGLKLQFIIMTIALVVITVFGSTYFFTQQEREVLLREITRRGATITRNLATISTDALISGDQLSLATFVDSIMKNDGVRYAMILDERGTILAHSEIGKVGKNYIEPIGVRPLTNEEILIQPFNDSNQEPITDIALPINLRNGVRIGAVHVGMSQKVVNQHVNQAFRESLSVAAGLLIIGIIVAIFVTNIMMKPVSELIRGVHAIGEGNLNYKINITGKSELAILAKSFNEMADNLKELYIGVLRSLAKALEHRDKFVGGHDQRVAEYATALAEHIGLDQEEIDNIRLAGQVQNIGHIAVPDKILEKTGKLSDAEYNKLKEHTVVGADILNQIEALHGAVPLVLHHHERYDGDGYPKGLSGKTIPLGARILSIADAFDAMTSAQKHRAAMSRTEAIDELKNSAGTQLDPELVGAFVDMLKTQQKEV